MLVKHPPPKTSHWETHCHCDIFPSSQAHEPQPQIFIKKLKELVLPKNVIGSDPPRQLKPRLKHSLKKPKIQVVDTNEKVPANQEECGRRQKVGGDS